MHRISLFFALTRNSETCPFHYLPYKTFLYVFDCFSRRPTSRPPSASSQASSSEPNTARSSASVRSYDMPDSGRSQPDSSRSVASVSKVDVVGAAGEPERPLPNHRLYFVEFNSIAMYSCPWTIGTGCSTCSFSGCQSNVFSHNSLLYSQINY